MSDAHPLSEATSAYLAVLDERIELLESELADLRLARSTLARYGNGGDMGVVSRFAPETKEEKTNG